MKTVVAVADRAARGLQLPHPAAVDGRAAVGRGLIDTFGSCGARRVRAVVRARHARSRCHPPTIDGDPTATAFPTVARPDEPEDKDMFQDRTAA
jgi:hypothetical protein